MNPENQNINAPQPVQPQPDILATGVSAEQSPVGQIPISPITPELPKPKSKLIPVLVVVLILVALGSLGYWAYQNYFVEKMPPSPVATSSPAPTLDPTANWQTYTNTRNSYSVKFPQNLTTQVNAPGALVAAASADAESIYIYEKNDKEPYLNRYIDITFLQVRPSVLETDWAEQKTTIGSYEATKLSPKASNAKFEIYYINSPNQKIAEIYLTRDSARNELANQVLSTFKFLEASPSSPPTSSPSATPQL